MYTKITATPDFNEAPSTPLPYKIAPKFKATFPAGIFFSILLHHIMKCLFIEYDSSET